MALSGFSGSWWNQESSGEAGESAGGEGGWAGPARRCRLALALIERVLGRGWGQDIPRDGEITEFAFRGGVRMGRGESAGAGRWKEVCFSRQRLGLEALNHKSPWSQII